MRVRVHPSSVAGSVTVPPSKSLMHRALLCAAMARGVSRVGPAILSDDIRATLSALPALGAGVREEGGAWVVEGGGQPVPAAIDCGESGSTLRFLIPLAALSGLPVTLTGRGRLLQRPLQVYREMFHSRGLVFDQTQSRVTIRGPLPPGEYAVAGDISSQFITGLLLALPLLKGDSRIVVTPPFASRPYVDLTLHMMARFGVAARFSDELTLDIPGGQHYRPAGVEVEGDFSQLAFFLVLGSLIGPLDCLGVPAGSLQGDRVIVDCLQRMGADIRPVEGGWRAAPGPLRGVDVDIADCPDLGPALAAAALYARGESRLFNAHRLRAKESDRAAAIHAEFSRLGGEIRMDGDTLVIRGSPAPAGGEAVVSGHNDHRMVMSLAVAAAGGRRPVVIEGAEAVQKSYPGFFDELTRLGVGWERLDD